MGMKIFLNLTNGIEAIKHISTDGFVRIQSTWCEQKRWDNLIADLDYNFLLNLAVGEHVVVLDYSSRAKNGVSRACWQGVPIIRATLNKIWELGEEKVIVKGQNCTNYFAEIYKALTRSTRRKIKYFKKFVMTENINLHFLCYPTRYDGREEFYRRALSVWTEMTHNKKPT